jgi:hypothetical protein
MRPDPGAERFYLVTRRSTDLHHGKMGLDVHVEGPHPYVKQARGP